MTNIEPYVEVVGPSSDENSVIVINAPRLFDGNGNFYENGASVWIEGSVIKAIYDDGSPDPGPGAQVMEFEDSCILPGLMDCCMAASASRHVLNIWRWRSGALPINSVRIIAAW